MKIRSHYYVLSLIINIFIPLLTQWYLDTMIPTMQPLCNLALKINLVDQLIVNL